MAQHDFALLTEKPCYRVMNTLGKIILTGICWLVFSLPVVTAGAASCAALEEFSPENEEIHGMFSRFSRNFCRHFRAMTPIWLLFLAAAALLVLDLMVYDVLMGDSGMAGTIVKTMVFVLLNYLVGLLRMLEYGRITEATASGGSDLKQAALSTVLHWSTWAAMMLIDMALAVFFWVTPYFLFLLPALPGLLAWMHNRMLSHAHRPRESESQVQSELPN